VKGKLAPRYVGPYQITKRIGSLAYQLTLPESMAGVHPVFHVSQLKKSEKEVEESKCPWSCLTCKIPLSTLSTPRRF
jgi:hypothetical protein